MILLLLHSNVFLGCILLLRHIIIPRDPLSQLDWVPGMQTCRGTGQKWPLKNIQAGFCAGPTLRSTKYLLSINFTLLHLVKRVILKSFNYRFYSCPLKILTTVLGDVQEMFSPSFLSMAFKELVSEGDGWFSNIT